MPARSTRRAHPLYFGPAVGSEKGWLDMARGSVSFATNFVSYITGEYTGEISAFDVGYTAKHVKRYNTWADDLNALDPDLRSFSRRGGKVLMWHGWADPGVPAAATIAYYTAVRKKAGEKAADGFSRLYMLPGVGHCAGGDGPDRFDLLSKVIAWVEDGAAPGPITAVNAKAIDRPWTIAPWPAAPTVPMALPTPAAMPTAAPTTGSPAATAESPAQN